jgi:hypothetical protein
MDLMQSLSKFHDILHRNRRTDSKIYMEAQKTLKSQSNLHQKTSAGGIT